MRLWTLHPRYLDAKGLVALWREALLAQAVLQGKTRGYRAHPQLQRFQQQPDPCAAVATYLVAVQTEATARGYRFQSAKIGRRRAVGRMAETRGQVEYEWQHLMRKLKARSPALSSKLGSVLRPRPHPLFRLVAGPVRDWEKI